jgi:hypothetical protein
MILEKSDGRKTPRQSVVSRLGLWFNEELVLNRAND